MDISKFDPLPTARDKILMLKLKTHSGFHDLFLNLICIEYTFHIGSFGSCDLWLFLTVCPHRNHYWSRDRYDLAILTPSKNKMSAFIAWISKCMIFHVLVAIVGSVQVLFKIDFKIDMWWFSNRLAARQKSYNKNT